MKSLGDEVNLQLNVGVIPVVAKPVTAKNDRWELRANVATARKPQASTHDLAAALGLAAADFSGQALWVNSGSEQLIVPLATADAVQRVHISAEQLQRATQDGPRAQAYVFADTGNNTLLSRFFFTKGHALAEDPATGSATANLGGWYLAHNPSLPLIKTISQGMMIGRPSTLQLRIDTNRNVFVSGEVIELGRGHVEL
jgi:PhzF family phenazine biosynthesis protein